MLTKKWLINGNNSIINEFPESNNEDNNVRFKMILNRSYIMLLSDSIIPEVLITLI